MICFSESAKVCKSPAFDQLTGCVRNVNMCLPIEREVNNITAEEKKFDKNQYVIDYKKKKVKRIPFDLSREHDADIIGHLERIPNVSRYLKDLIRNDMKNDG